MARGLRLSDAMRIKITQFDPPVNDDTRRYAEYRVFTSIAPHESRVRSVDVVVRRDPASALPFVCAVVIDLDGSGRIKTQARAAHPNAAIDRAADRAAWLVNRRVERDFTVKSTVSVRKVGPS